MELALDFLYLDIKNKQILKNKMYSGVLRKMLTENLSPIGYFLKLEQGFINLNQC